MAKQSEQGFGGFHDGGYPAGVRVNDVSDPPPRRQGWRSAGARRVLPLQPSAAASAPSELASSTVAVKDNSREPAPPRGRIDALVAISEGNAVRLTGVPPRVLYRSNGQRTSAKGPADFMGLCRMTHRLIVFDTLESRHRSLLLLEERQFPRHQRNVLVAYGQDGAVAGVLAAATHPDLQMLLWVPWGALLRGDERLSWADDRFTNLGPLTEVIDFTRVPGVAPRRASRADIWA